MYGWKMEKFMDSKKSKIRSALSRSRYLFILMAAMLVIIAFIKPVLAIPAAVMLIAAVIMNVLDVRNEEKTLISDYFEDLF